MINNYNPNIQRSILTTNKIDYEFLVIVLLTMLTFYSITTFI